jgi:hypothetical protein
MHDIFNISPLFRKFTTDFLSGHFLKIPNEFKNVGIGFKSFQRITISFQLVSITNKLHLLAQVLIE